MAKVIKVGDFVHCAGEGLEVFKVTHADPKGRSFALCRADGMYHGDEDYSKLTPVSVKDVEKITIVEWRLKNWEKYFK